MESTLIFIDFFDFIEIQKFGAIQKLLLLFKVLFSKDVLN